MKKIAWIMIFLLIIGVSMPVSAEITKRTATIKQMAGTVEVSADEKRKAWFPAQEGMKLTEGQAIKTHSESMAVLYLDTTEKAEVEIKEKTELRLTELFEDTGAGTQTTMLDLAIGEVLITSQKLRASKSKFEVKTPTSIVGVRGTTFSVLVEKIE